MRQVKIKNTEPSEIWFYLQHRLKKLDAKLIFTYQLNKQLRFEHKQVYIHTVKESSLNPLILWLRNPKSQATTRDQG